MHTYFTRKGAQASVIRDFHVVHLLKAKANLLIGSLSKEYDFKPHVQSISNDIPVQSNE